MGTPKLPCTDPGESEFSQRTWSGTNFPTGSTITYTCDPYTLGGGTIKCHSNGQYNDTKPRCEKLSCLRPQIENGQLIPSSDEYLCGEKILYACDEGFTLMGEITRTCLPSGQFDGSTTCVRNGSTVLMVAIISAVGGCVLFAVLVGALVFCVRRILKKNKKPEAPPTDMERHPPDGGPLIPPIRGLFLRERGVRVPRGEDPEGLGNVKTGGTEKPKANSGYGKEGLPVLRKYGIRKWTGTGCRGRDPDEQRLRLFESGVESYRWYEKTNSR